MFNRPNYMVREHVGFLKMSDTYDILDPETQRQVGVAQERNSGWITALRLLVSKQVLPTRVVIIEGEDPKQTPVLSLVRGFTLFRSRVRILGADGQEIASFRSRLFTIGGAFDIFDPSGRQIGSVKGNWKGWAFVFLDETGKERGKIAKQWAGIGKELLTSADTYVVSLSEGSPPALMPLLLAAGLAIDVVFKER